MSYDLAVWEGPRPADDEQAAADFERLSEAYLEAEVPAPPTARVKAYVEALLTRWPDLTELDDDVVDDSPWAAGPLIGEATGPLIYFGLVWSQADAVAGEMAAMATEHGLVCFDPQTERLRPGLPAGGRFRGWLRRLR